MPCFMCVEIFMCAWLLAHGCFRKYFEWYSVQNWRKNIKEIDFYNLFGLLENEKKL